MGKGGRGSLVSEDAAVATICRTIAVLRRQRVMLDADLAALYGVRTKVLNQAVKRNRHRFPRDFMFRLTRSEVAALNRSQAVTGSQNHRDPRFPPPHRRDQTRVARNTRAGATRIPSGVSKSFLPVAETCQAAHLPARALR